MAEVLTKSAARNVFYGGSFFFFAIFVGLTAHSHYYMNTTSTDTETLFDSVARGKHVWERNSCINCHSIVGEGAYFAPELGNVWDQRSAISVGSARRDASVFFGADTYIGPAYLAVGYDEGGTTALYLYLGRSF